MRKYYEQVLMQILEDGIAGDFRSVDAKGAMFGILGMLNWAHQWLDPEGPLSSKQIAAIPSDLALY